MSDEAPIPGTVDATLAEDVKVVKRYIHCAFGEKKEGFTPQRKVLHDWATRKNQDGDYINLEAFWKMEKEADKVLADQASDTFIAEKSKKSVKQLRELLRGVIAESKEIVP